MLRISDLPLPDSRMRQIATLFLFYFQAELIKVLLEYIKTSSRLAARLLSKHQNQHNRTSTTKTLSTHTTQRQPSSSYILTSYQPPEYTMKSTTLIVPALVALAPIVAAGPAAYGICQAGCAAVVTACVSNLILA